MFIRIEGPLDDLRGLSDINGLELQAGAKDLGGGRWRASAYVKAKSAVDEVKRRGLTVTVVMDEEETKRRMDADHEMMKDAFRDAGSGDGGGGKNRKP